MGIDMIFPGENYGDVNPVGVCCVCGDEIMPGEFTYKTADGLVCGSSSSVAEPILCGKKTAMDCMMVYIAQSHCTCDIAEALGFTAKVTDI